MSSVRFFFSSIVTQTPTGDPYWPHVSAFPTTLWIKLHSARQQNLKSLWDSQSIFELNWNIKYSPKCFFCDVLLFYIRSLQKMKTNKTLLQHQNVWLRQYSHLGWIVAVLTFLFTPCICVSATYLDPWTHTILEANPYKHIWETQLWPLQKHATDTNQPRIHSLSFLFGWLMIYRFLWHQWPVLNSSLTGKRRERHAANALRLGPQNKRVEYYRLYTRGSCSTNLASQFLKL